MGKCCDSKNSNKESSSQCKECGGIGKPVKNITLLHLVKKEKLASKKNIPYFFCSTPNCDIVYFSNKGDAFYKTDLKIRVGIKETEEPIPVCYCFGYTKKMILDDIAQNGYWTIEAKIKEAVRLKECRCEITNPKGACCLGEVSKIVKRRKGRAIEK